MLKEGCEADAVVGHVLFLAHDCDVVLSCPRVKFEEFLSGKGSGVSPGLGELPHSSIVCQSVTYMKLMPTMPRPTTTTLLRAPTAIFGGLNG